MIVIEIRIWLLSFQVVWHNVTPRATKKSYPQDNESK
jgi:hypothetical protein